MKMCLINSVRCIVMAAFVAMVGALTYTIVLLVHQETQLDEMGVSIQRISRNIGILEIERLKARVIELEQDELETNTTKLFKDCEEQN